MTIGRKEAQPAGRTIARLARARITIKMKRSSTPYRKWSRASNGPALILYEGAPHEFHLIHGSSFVR